MPTETVDTDRVTKVYPESAEWDRELILLWKQSGLSVHHLWMADLKMRLYGRNKAFEWLRKESGSVTR